MSSIPRTLKLGTRRSLLAWAQSSWVARSVEAVNPGLKVELVGIETSGDKILDIPLRNVEGKEFFVAELDHALQKKEVDFTVHSMKDLSLDRPEEFVLAAVPKRENPRDVILFAPSVLEKIKAGEVLKIGTSSPRRIENIPAFLEKALPRFSTEAPKLKLVEIRGNVNTRLSRTREPQSSERFLDGVVLAFAGLIRLWKDAKGKEELQKLLYPQNALPLRWMVLPLAQNPTAPAQGVLAVECRKDDAPTRQVLQGLQDDVAKSAAQKERAVLRQWGGGCHQRFGATALTVDGAGDLLFIRGVTPDGTFVEETQWSAKPQPLKNSGPVRAWDGSEWRKKLEQSAAMGEGSTTSAQVASGAGSENSIALPAAVFVAHSRAAFSDKKSLVLFHVNTRVWTSGVPSWFRLAENGVWVEGCAEGLGYARAADALSEPVLGLPSENEWAVLTHAGGTKGWGQQKVLPTYEIVFDKDLESQASAELDKSDHVYWSSGSQFDRFKNRIQPHQKHYCGFGKTLVHLKLAGINPQVFPQVEEWRKWIRSSV